MGKLFRGSERGVRNAYIGKTTVKAGECALLFTLGGKCRVVEGPKRERVFCTTIRFLDRHVADAHQYIRIQKQQTGEIQHFPGPATIYHNPVQHHSVEVRHAIKLGEGDAVAVYGGGGVAGKEIGASRRVVVGPRVLVPEPHEWLHEFKWRQGTRAAVAGDGDGCGAKTVVSLRRECLKLSLPAAATAGGDTVSLQLELAYAVTAEGLDSILAQTADPVEELEAALKADALAVCKGLSTEKAAGGGSALGTLEWYKQTRAVASQLAVSLARIRCSVVDSMGAETETAARKAQTASHRRQQEHQLEIEHSQRMAQQRLIEEESALQREMRSAEQRRELRKQEHDFDLAMEKERTDQELDRLTRLNALGVDLTTLLVAQTQPPSRPQTDAAAPKPAAAAPKPSHVR